MNHRRDLPSGKTKFLTEEISIFLPTLRQFCKICDFSDNFRQVIEYVADFQYILLVVC